MTNSILGTRVGRLLILEVESCRKTVHGANYVKYNCLCDCGTVKSIPHCKLISKSRPTTSCGCYRKERNLEVVTQRGCRKSRVYHIWCGMKRRCYNKNDLAYPQYGGSGITVCDRWKNSFQNFLSDMGEPWEDMSLNRVDGAKIYSKETCEWATATRQCYDQKMRKDNQSGRTGVCWDKEANKWLATISKGGTQLKLGRFVDFDEAVAAREAAEIRFYGELKQEARL